TQRACALCAAASELPPNEEQCAHDVERAARVTGGWDELIAAYERSIQRADDNGDPMLAIDPRPRLGRVLLDEVRRVDDALAQFRAVYDADDENPAAISALERLYRETGRHADLLKVYEKKRDLTADPDEKKQILY